MLEARIKELEEKNQALRDHIAADQHYVRCAEEKIKELSAIIEQQLVTIQQLTPEMPLAERTSLYAFSKEYNPPGWANTVWRMLKPHQRTWFAEVIGHCIKPMNLKNDQEPGRRDRPPQGAAWRGGL